MHATWKIILFSFASRFLRMEKNPLLLHVTLQFKDNEMNEISFKNIKQYNADKLWFEVIWSVKLSISVHGNTFFSLIF